MRPQDSRIQSPSIEATKQSREYCNRGQETKSKVGWILHACFRERTPARSNPVDWPSLLLYSIARDAMQGWSRRGGFPHCLADPTAQVGSLARTTGFRGWRWPVRPFVSLLPCRGTLRVGATIVPRRTFELETGCLARPAKH